MRYLFLAALMLSSAPILASAETVTTTSKSYEPLLTAHSSHGFGAHDYDGALVKDKVAGKPVSSDETTKVFNYAPNSQKILNVNISQESAVAIQFRGNDLKTHIMFVSDPDEYASAQDGNTIFVRSATPAFMRTRPLANSKSTIFINVNGAMVIIGLNPVAPGESYDERVVVNMLPSSSVEHVEAKH